MNAEALRAEAMNAETARLDAVRPDAVRLEAVRADTVRAGAVAPGSARPRVEPSETARSGDGHIGPALRRLMVTPTFAAGLGVVVAAGLAVNMTARTVLHFSGPDQQKVCSTRPCVNQPNLPGGGTLASAKPGIRLEPATLSPSGPAEPHLSSTGQGASTHSSAGQVVIAYQTTQRWSWGFDGQIVISKMPASSLGSWRLAFDYPGTSIVEVEGAQWEPTGQNSGVAEPETSTSNTPGSGGPAQNGSDADGANAGKSGPNPASQSGQQHSVVITIEASGPASAPSGCRFDNSPCSFSH